MKEENRISYWINMFLSRKKNAATKRSYRSTLERLRNFLFTTEGFGLRAPSLDDFSFETVSNFLEKRSSEISNSSLASEYDRIRALASFVAKRSGWKNTVAEIEPPKFKRRRKQPLAAELEQKVRECIYYPHKSLSSQKLAVQLMMQFRLGLRPSEPLWVNYWQLDMRNLVFRSVLMKGGKQKDICFLLEHAEVIQRYLELRAEAIRDHFQKFGSKIKRPEYLEELPLIISFYGARPDDLSSYKSSYSAYQRKVVDHFGFPPHLLRHSSVRQAFEKGGLTAARDRANHSTLVTTDTYLGTRLDDERENLAA